jgi:hypothetical protein
MFKIYFEGMELIIVFLRHNIAPLCAKYIFVELHCRNISSSPVFMSSLFDRDLNK